MSLDLEITVDTTTDFEKGKPVFKVSGGYTQSPRDNISMWGFTDVHSISEGTGYYSLAQQISDTKYFVIYTSTTEFGDSKHYGMIVTIDDENRVISKTTPEVVSDYNPYQSQSYTAELMHIEGNDYVYSYPVSDGAVNNTHRIRILRLDPTTGNITKGAELEIINTTTGYGCTLEVLDNKDIIFVGHHSNSTYYNYLRYYTYDETTLNLSETNAINNILNTNYSSYPPNTTIMSEDTDEAIMLMSNMYQNYNQEYVTIRLNKISKSASVIAHNQNATNRYYTTSLYGSNLMRVDDTHAIFIAANQDAGYRWCINNITLNTSGGIVGVGSIYNPWSDRGTCYGTFPIMHSDGNLYVLAQYNGTSYMYKLVLDTAGNVLEWEETSAPLAYLYFYSQNYRTNGYKHSIFERNDGTIVIIAFNNEGNPADHVNLMLYDPKLATSEASIPVDFVGIATGKNKVKVSGIVNRLEQVTEPFTRYTVDIDTGELIPSTTSSTSLSIDPDPDNKVSSYTTSVAIDINSLNIEQLQIHNNNIE